MPFVLIFIEKPAAHTHVNVLSLTHVRARTHIRAYAHILMLEHTFDAHTFTRTQIYGVSSKEEVSAGFTQILSSKVSGY